MPKIKKRTPAKREKNISQNKTAPKQSVVFTGRNYPQYVARGQRAGSFRLILITAIVTAIIVIGAILAWNYLIFPNFFSTDNTDDTAFDNYAIPLNIEVPNNQPIDSMADWLVYQNDDRGFQIKYPNGLVLTAGEDGIMELKDENVPEVRLVIALGNATTTVEDYLTEADKITAVVYEGGPSVEVKNQVDFTFNDLKAVTRHQALLAADLEEIVSYLPVKNKIVFFRLEAPVISQALIDFYNQLLATFELIKEGVENQIEDE